MPVAVPTGWTLSTIDTVEDVGRHLSLAFSPATNLPVLSYLSQPVSGAYLRNATPQAGGNCGPGSTWQCTTHGYLSHTIGSETATAFAPDGTLGVVYWDLTDNVNRLNWGSLSDEPIDTQSTAISVGLDNSLAFDASGLPHLAYVTLGPGKVRYARYVGSGGSCGGPDGDWQCDDIDDANGDASIVLTASGSPRIAYRGAANELKFARKLASASGNCGPGNTWQCDVIDGVANVFDTGDVVSLWLPTFTGCDGAPRIAYYDATLDTLKFAEFVGSGGGCGPAGSWHCSSIEVVGQNLASMFVAIGGRGNEPTIAYLDANDRANTTLKMARPAPGGTGGNCSFGVWRCTTLDDGDRGGVFHSVGEFVAIDHDRNGAAGIAYFDTVDDDLMYLRELPLFADGFESGNTSAWSLSSP